MAKFSVKKALAVVGALTVLGAGVFFGIDAVSDDFNVVFHPDTNHTQPLPEPEPTPTPTPTPTEPEQTPEPTPENTPTPTEPVQEENVVSSLPKTGDELLMGAGIAGVAAVGSASAILGNKLYQRHLDKDALALADGNSNISEQIDALNEIKQELLGNHFSEDTMARYGLNQVKTK